MTEWKRPLGRTINRRFAEKVIRVARALDVMNAPNNVYDANWGGSQLWCRDNETCRDVPACWNAPLTPGIWGKSELVGDLHFDQREDDQIELVLVIYARELLDWRRQQAIKGSFGLPVGRRSAKSLRRARDPEVLLPPADRECLFVWLRDKSLALLRLAQLESDVTGHHCPFCSWVLYPGEMLNKLVEHVAERHPERRLKGVLLGEPAVLQTESGDFEVKPVEVFLP